MPVKEKNLNGDWKGQVVKKDVGRESGWKKMGELKGRLKGQGTEQSGLCLLPLSLSQVQSLWRSGPRVSWSADYGAASINRLPTLQHWVALNYCLPARADSRHTVTLEKERNQQKVGLCV